MSIDTSYAKLNTFALFVAENLPEYALTERAVENARRVCTLSRIDNPLDQLHMHFAHNSDSKRVMIYGGYNDLMNSVCGGSQNVSTPKSVDPITVSIDRSGRAVAADITRKLLPAHSVAVLEATQRLRDYKERRTRHISVIKLAEKHFPLPPAWVDRKHLDLTKESNLSNVRGWTCPSPRIGQVTTGDNYVQIELTLKPEECAEVAAFIASLSVVRSGNL